MGWFGISLKLPNGLLWTTGKKDPGTLSNLYQVVWKLECRQKTFECQNISVNEGSAAICAAEMALSGHNTTIIMHDHRS